MKEMKRLISLLLCFVMVVGFVPASVFEVKATGDTIYVLAGGDFQAGDNGQADHYYSSQHVANILAAIDDKYSTMDGFIFVGDYDGETHEDSHAVTGIAALMDTVDNTYSNLNHENSILMQGNHESANVSGIDPTGGYEFDGYAVYVMNQVDYCEKQTGLGNHIQNVANNLEIWLNNKLGEGYDAPIFITAHVPLAYGTRTYTNGDGLYAKYVFDVINEAAENGLNIIFLHGHDHAFGADNYLGGEAIYLPVGDKINICVPGDKASWTEETLNFTYMNAGYVGYYNENYYNVNSYEEEKLTMTVFAITGNEVTVERYSKNGLYNLKSEGREGFYSNAGTCANIGLSYNLATYASPQTIELKEAEDYGTIDTWVGVEAEVADDVTAESEGWVELVAPIPGTPAVEASTTYKYTLDNDGTVNDRYDAELGYLIVAYNSGYAMTGNGSIGSTGVTVSSNTITLDSQPTYEWRITSDNKITNGTYWLTANPGYSSCSIGVSTDESDAYTWAISHSGNGQYGISATYDGTFSDRIWYLRYSSNSFSTARNGSNLTVRLFSGEKIVIEGSDAIPGTEGTYGKINGELSIEVPLGTAPDAALIAVQNAVNGYYYNAMSTPAADVDGIAVEDDVLTWELDPDYNGDIPGDYAVDVYYQGAYLGTAEVVVPAATTYYMAEGNELYIVPMNTSADNAKAAVVNGIKVYAATTAGGEGKTEIEDYSKVSYIWKDVYSGTNAGPYTMEILYDGHSLGTVEVKVNVQYETGIVDGWTYIETTTGSGGTTTVTYTLDTDGIEAGSGNKYIIVARDAAYLLDAGSARSVTISSDGKTATTSTRDYEYYFTGSTSGLITRDGTNTLYQQNWGIHVGNVSDSNLDMFVNNGSGYYRLYDGDGTARSLYYDGSSWTVTSADHTSSTYTVRLYKFEKEETVGGTGGGDVYAKLEGAERYTVDQGTTLTNALAKVKAGITVYTSNSADGSNPTELSDDALTYTWKNNYLSSVPGNYWLEISYKGKPLGVVEVVVEPGVVNNYPEYPDEGAVHVGKTATGIDFQSTGLAQVEVSASGVPVKKGADVIIMVDTSSSMNTCIAHGTRNCTISTCQGNYRSHVFEDSLENLIKLFKTPGADDKPMDLKVAIADFNGFDKNTDTYPWSWNPNDILVDDAAYDATNYGTVFTGPNANTRDLTSAAFVNPADLKDSYSFSYHSGTNYDYAFDVIYQLATAIKEKNGNEDRDLYVIFMSDGAPMQYNFFHSNGRSDLLQYYLQGQITETSSLRYRYDGQESNSYQTATGYGAFKSTANTAYYNTEGKHWMAEAIKGDPTQTYPVIRKGIAGADEDGFLHVNGLGAKMFSIAFCPAVDQHTPVVAMTYVLERIATDLTYYHNVSTAEGLNNAFNAIGSEIAYAANNARYVDQMGDDFNLQLTPFVDLNDQPVLDADGNQMTPAIEILSYDIYTKAEADEVAEGTAGDTVTNSMIGDRKNTAPKLLEVVVFSADGTKAYSNLIDVDKDGTYGVTVTNGKYTIADEDDNILDSNGVIYAYTFMYNNGIHGVAVEGVNIPTGVKSDGTTTGSTNVLPSETFYWKMGTVQTTELAMRYYVYLEGSMQGTCEAGSYPTNEYAILYYDNYLGNPCHKDTVSPVMAWKSANVSYAFYLVNENGEIIVNQTTGQTGSFANKIPLTNVVLYDEILLNSGEYLKALEIKAISDDVLPKYYKLYDEAAAYSVYVPSEGAGNWSIVKSDGKIQSTYVTQFDPENANAYSYEQTSENSAYDYTHTVVWFAVVWSVQAHPDSVVVDFGLPVEISVLNNDMFGTAGKLAGIGAYDASLESIVGGDALAAGFGSNYDGEYGVATTDNTTGKVRYELDTMEMNGYEKFSYAVNFNGVGEPGYYYDHITVIPATTIYYEDEFIDFDKLTWQQEAGGYEWEGEWVVVPNAGSTIWTSVGEKTSGVTQDEDRPGKYSLTDANNIYGYDGAYKDLTTYSLGSAMKATVDYDNAAQASFSFYGTGFDVISMTDSTTGTILVKLYPINENGTLGELQKNLLVDTYYGYKQANCHVIYTYHITKDTEGNAIGGEWVISEVLHEAANCDGSCTVATEKPQTPAEGTEVLMAAEAWIEAPDGDAIWQVPVMKVSGLTYGHYKAEIQAIYDPGFDHRTNDAVYDFYLDAIRIYDPANDGAVDGSEDSTIEDAYVADGEGWPSYKELRNILIGAETLGNASTNTQVEGIVFIDGDEEVKNAQISDYTGFGPNNEVYLKPGQRVAFILELPQNIDKVHIGIKSADGKTGTYTITNIAKTSNSETGVDAGTYYGAQTKKISTTTDMYYDLTGWKNDIIVISNTGNRTENNTTGIISLTNIKFTYKTNPNGTQETSETENGLNRMVPVSGGSSITTFASAAAANTVTEAESEAVLGYAYMTPAAAVLTIRALNEEAEEEIPETTEPETTEPETTEPETTEPETTEPETTEPETTEPETTEPETTEPEATEPEEKPDNGGSEIWNKIADLIGKLIGWIFG